MPLINHTAYVGRLAAAECERNPHCAEERWSLLLTFGKDATSHLPGLSRAELLLLKKAVDDAVFQSGPFPGEELPAECPPGEHRFPRTAGEAACETCGVTTPF